MSTNFETRYIILTSAFRLISLRYGELAEIRDIAVADEFTGSIFEGLFIRTFVIVGVYSMDENTFTSFAWDSENICGYGDFIFDTLSCDEGTVYFKDFWDSTRMTRVP